MSTPLTSVNSTGGPKVFDGSPVVIIIVVVVLLAIGLYLFFGYRKR